jgi:antitoxin HigA-1
MIRLPTDRAPTHPGEILLEEFLIPTGISQQQLANAIRVPYQRVNEIVNGRRGITASTALRLAKFLGTSQELWLNLQAQWDLYHAQRSEQRTLDLITPLIYSRAGSQVTGSTALKEDAPTWETSQEKSADAEFSVTGWNNGAFSPSGSGYGVKLACADRDRHFNRDWQAVTLELPQDNGYVLVTVNANKDSFWGPHCRELIDRRIGRWLIESGLAPWPEGHPPKLRMRALGGGRFRVIGAVKSSED